MKAIAFLDRGILFDQIFKDSWVMYLFDPISGLILLLSNTFSGLQNLDYQSNSDIEDRLGRVSSN